VEYDILGYTKVKSRNVARMWYVHIWCP